MIDPEHRSIDEETPQNLFERLFRKILTTVTTKEGYFALVTVGESLGLNPREIEISVTHDEKFEASYYKYSL